jgi:hypothetical protein
VRFGARFALGLALRSLRNVPNKVLRTRGPDLALLVVVGVAIMRRAQRNLDRVEGR